MDDVAMYLVANSSGENADGHERHTFAAARFTEGIRSRISGNRTGAARQFLFSGRLVR